MLLGSVAVMNSSQYFPEFVKAKTAAGLMFSMIYRKPKTGDASLGEQIVSFFFLAKKNIKMGLEYQRKYPLRRCQVLLSPEATATDYEGTTVHGD